MWQEISPSEFSWERYIGKVGFALSQVVNDQYATPLRLNPDVRPVGFCDATQLRIRPRTSGFAFMVIMDDEQFWFHDENMITFRA